MGINGLGDQITVISPDSGTTTRTFDAGGNIRTSIDARGEKTTYFYDKLNRTLEELYADGTLSRFTYDQGKYGIGHLTTMTDPSGSTTWGNNINGQVLQKHQKIGTVTLTTTHTYNAVTGQMKTTTLPSKHVLTYGYDANGNIASITSGKMPVVSNVTYDAFGGPNEWTQGGRLHHYRTTDLDGRVSEIRFENSKAPGGQQSIALTRDFAGLVKEITDNTGAPQIFGYDGVNEVASYSTKGITDYFSYDLNGNRTVLSV